MAVFRVFVDMMNMVAAFLRQGNIDLTAVSGGTAALNVFFPVKTAENIGDPSGKISPSGRQVLPLRRGIPFLKARTEPLPLPGCCAAQIRLPDLLHIKNEYHTDCLQAFRNLLKFPFSVPVLLLFFIA